MKISRWISPVIVALLILTGVRLVSDVPQNYHFWEHMPARHLIELLFAVAACYLFDYVLHTFFAWNQRKEKSRKRKRLVVEYGLLILIIMAILNPLVAVIHFFTNDDFSLPDFVIANVIGILFVILFYTLLRSEKISEAYAEQRLQLEKVKSDQLQTELKFLRSQYHPHFLFNALNTVYFQIDERNEQPRRTLEMLSDLLRYQLYGAANQQVSVRQELDYLKTYIDLQKLRMSERLQLTTFFDPLLDEQEIQPLLFLPLVENAFKYVGGDYIIEISARLENDKVRFEITNSVPPYADAAPSHREGIGLENLERRLALLYPGRHTFVIDRKETLFGVKLIIDLKTDAN